MNPPVALETVTCEELARVAVADTAPSPLPLRSAIAYSLRSSTSRTALITRRGKHFMQRKDTPWLIW